MSEIWMATEEAVRRAALARRDRSAPPACSTLRAVLTRASYARAEGQSVGVVTIRGALVAGTTIAAYYGVEELNVSEAAAALRQAAGDAGAAAVLLEIDSPGGEYAALSELLAAADELARAKPLYALANTQCCSLAYPLACAARQIWALPSASVGSLGTLGSLVDDSKFWADLGVRFVHAGRPAGKALLREGQPVTDAALERVRATVDDAHAAYVAAVSRRRPALTARRIEELDARWFDGERALREGLIDAVAPSRAEAIARVAAMHAASQPETTMSTTPTATAPGSAPATPPAAAQAAPAPGSSTAAGTAPDVVATSPAPGSVATLEQLTALTKGTDPAFVVAALGEKLTIDAARERYAHAMAERARAAEARAAELERAQQAQAQEQTRRAGAVRGAEPVAASVRPQHGPHALHALAGQEAAALPAGVKTRADAAALIQSEGLAAGRSVRLIDAYAAAAKDPRFAALWP